MDSAQISDRELLEGAALAAGLEFSWRPHVSPGSSGCWLAIRDEQNSWLEWNPLTDDGDALRLAVKLRLQLDTDLGVQRTCVADCRYTAAQSHEAAGADPYAATRRAIVRAAAAIGAKP